MNTQAPTVLVIDDDHDIAELLACFLARDGLRPAIALNGIMGLQQARDLLPSVILCDSCMPGMGGLKVIERLRGDAVTAGIPIVLMSGDPGYFKDSGANAFLQKPFRITEVLAMARSFTPAATEIARESHEAWECAAQRRGHSQAVLA
ncbi:MAG TPA: response regulator [Methylomirabilota bacterium]|nr:response regulator [Methylomirabilota bacterium]